MSVIVKLQVPAADFEFGRVFSAIGTETTVELESLVPVPGSSTPFVWICGPDHDALVAEIAAHPTIHAVERVESLRGQSLYALDWAIEYDHLFRALREYAVQVLSAKRVGTGWRFTLRFLTHRSLSRFRDYCTDARIGLDVARIYNMPEAQPDQPFGLSRPQREALVLAVREGYYDIPRGCNTADIAELLSISDQAVTERLRRAIATLTRNTVMAESLPR
ncbi:helix-turn-helix domain-containing protein [Halalkalicoccus tibetensis]|uniref:Helix-turn-helix domain-containing protein n=1 Tax=Halalkalicoccus tibetensis TaxID=175632 RepID=A0ABD5UY15_9EURY